MGMEAKRVRPIWVTSLVLAALGLVDSLYLTWVKLAGAKAACAGVGDCESVNNSIYSEIGGFPVALLGAGAYLLMLMLLVAEPRFPSWRENLVLAFFGISLIGVLYSAYLTYIEIAVLRAICPYCVVSAVILTALFVISLIRLREPALAADTA